jgi:hypothetical protein
MSFKKSRMTSAFAASMARLLMPTHGSSGAEETPVRKRCWNSAMQLRGAMPTALLTTFTAEMVAGGGLGGALDLANFLNQRAQ